MLKIDINKLPESDIQRIVAERCALHGAVAEVFICDPTPVVDYKLAFVHMADPERVTRLVKAFQAIKVNTASVIRIDPLSWALGNDGVLKRS